MKIIAILAGIVVLFPVAGFILSSFYTGGAELESNGGGVPRAEDVIRTASPP